MPLVTPDQVPSLIPEAPAPGEAHLALAEVWARGQLGLRQINLDTLEPEQLPLARTAIAARALAVKAGFGGALALEQSGAGQAARVIESVKIDGEIETKFRAPQARDVALVSAASGWQAMAEEALALIPSPTRPLRLFPGASR